MAFEDISLNSRIENKISWAADCFERYKEVLFADKMTVELLVRLKKAIDDSRREMKSIGLVEECRLCEEKEGGACCGAGIENRYSGTLLLINLMMEVILPEFPYENGSCYFLTEKGCSLKARHVICVNYICGKITDKINPEKLAGLREKEGRELELLFLLNERIKKVLKDACR